MPRPNLIGIWQNPYTTGNPPATVSGHIYRQGESQGVAAFLNATMAAIAQTFVTSPPNAGTSCLTLLAWVSGGVLQDAVVVCQNRGESDEAFIDRAKRIFNEALTNNPPD